MFVLLVFFLAFRIKHALFLNLESWRQDSDLKIAYRELDLTSRLLYSILCSSIVPIKLLQNLSCRPCYGLACLKLESYH